MPCIKNARITGTRFGFDNGILTCWLHLDLGGGGIGFGGYALDGYDPEVKERIPSGKGLLFMSRIMKVLEVEKWEDLKGKYCRVELTEEFGRCTGRLFNILTDECVDVNMLKE